MWLKEKDMNAHPAATLAAIALSLVMAPLLVPASGTASAAGDAVAGKAIFDRVCHKCHAALPYTGRVKNLAAFLANPRRANPKTAMTFPGLRSKKEIDDVITYITGD
jgi:cytochrome c2